jgi:hypothetical protein
VLAVNRGCVAGNSSSNTISAIGYPQFSPALASCQEKSKPLSESSLWLISMEVSRQAPAYMLFGQVLAEVWEPKNMFFICTNVNKEIDKDVTLTSWVYMLHLTRCDGYIILPK